MSYIPELLRKQVQERASYKCEYCQLNAKYVLRGFEVDHIRAEKHDGKTVSENLCLSCYDCNHFKGTDLSSVDPLTDEVELLFDPRRDQWVKHFQLQSSGHIEGLTPKGRTTVRLLKMNLSRRVTNRRQLINLEDKEV
jgi:hypothetical protein